MKIMLISPLPPPSGGIASWTTRFLAWSKGKLDVLVVNTALIGTRAAKAGARMKVCEELSRSLRIVRETAAKLREKPDIVHLNTSCSKVGIMRDWLCVRMANMRGVPVIVHCHCNIEDQLGSGKLAISFFRNMVKLSSAVLVLNDRSKCFVQRFGSNRVRICPNFVLEEQIAASHVIRDTLETFLYVGDVRFAKGSDDIYQLADQFPEKRFVLAGSVAEEMKAVKKPKNVTLLGRLEASDVCKWMDQADVFLFPSLTEGFSNALLEAMARGLPVLATDVGANMDMIEKRGGEIVAVHDMAAMKAAVIRMESCSLRAQMSAWNIRKTAECYTQNVVICGLLDDYHAAL